MNIKKMPLGPMAANCYILWDDTTFDCAVIDPVYAENKLSAFLAENQLNVTKILLTHGHFDHIGGVGFVKKIYPDAQVCIHPADADCLTNAGRNLSTLVGNPINFTAADVLLNEGDIVTVGNDSLRVIHTPGHSGGGLCFVGDDVIFTGDTLFCGSVGRTDFPDGDFQILLDSLDKVMDCGANLKVCPGHGEDSDLAYERQMNPFVRRRGQW